LQILKVELGRLEDAPGPCAFRWQQAAAMVEPTMRASRDGAEQVQVSDQRVWCRDVGTKTRRCRLLGEPEDE
jgi:hypothetical protein